MGRRNMVGVWSRSIIALAIVAALTAPNVAAQDTNPADGEGLVVDYPVFNPVQPPSGYLTALEAGTRRADGRPGADYWQQWVDYDIDVKIEPETALVTASSRQSRFGTTRRTSGRSSFFTCTRTCLRKARHAAGAPRSPAA